MRRVRCRDCKFCRRFVVEDAYGKRYQVIRCMNPKVSKDKVNRDDLACDDYRKREFPESGSYCSILKLYIIYDDTTKKKKIPCSTCPVRCVWSKNKEMRNYITKCVGGKTVFLSDVVAEVENTKRNVVKVD